MRIIAGSQLNLEFVVHFFAITLPKIIHRRRAPATPTRVVLWKALRVQIPQPLSDRCSHRVHRWVGLDHIDCEVTGAIGIDFGHGHVFLSRDSSLGESVVLVEGVLLEIVLDHEIAIFSGVCFELNWGSALGVVSNDCWVRQSEIEIICGCNGRIGRVWEVGRQRL